MGLPSAIFEPSFLRRDKTGFIQGNHKVRLRSGLFLFGAVASIPKSCYLDHARQALLRENGMRMESLPNIFLRIVDFFLSRRNLVSAESRMRARIIVFTLLFWVFLDVLALLSAKLMTWDDIIVISVCLVVNVILAFLIKNAYSPEKVTLSYIALIQFIQVLGIYFSRAPNPFLVAVFISGIYTACLIINDLRQRIAVLCIALTSTFLAYLCFFGKMGGEFLTFPANAASGALTFQLASTVAQFVTLSMVSKIKEIAQGDLDLEIEWQDRMKRLGEVSSMTNTMRRLLAHPIETLRRDLKEIEQAPDPFTEGRLQRQLDELLLISQSCGWIYRAHENQGSFSISSSTLMKQVEVLLSTKAEDDLWTIEVKHKGQSVDIYGPIPLIVLFLYTFTVHVLEQGQPHELRRLSLEFEHREERAIWTMRWPFPARESGLARDSSDRISSVSMQEDLARDLTHKYNADIQRLRDQDNHQVLLTGPWRRLTFLTDSERHP